MANNTGNPIGSTSAKDLSDNAQNLDRFSNGDDYEYQDRLGRTRKSLKWMEDAALAIPAIEAAQRSEQQADRADIAKSEAETARDAAQLSGGVYSDVAAGLASTPAGKFFSVPSPESTEYLILYQNSSGAALEVKRYPSAGIMEPVTATKLSIESGTIKLGMTTFNSNITDSAFTSALGYAAPYACTATRMNIVTAGPSAGEVHVYRHNGVARGQHTLELIIAVTLPLTGVNEVALPNIILDAGDIVAYAPKSGGYLRGNTASTLAGVWFVPAPTAVGGLATIGAVVRPSIELILVKSEKVNAFENRIRKAESGVGASIDSVLASFGSLAVGAGAPVNPVTSFSFGASEASPERSLLSSVRHKTNTLNGMVYYLVVILRLQSGTTYQVGQLIPVSVRTDAGGIATAGPVELGRVVLEKGDRVHIYASNVQSGAVLYNGGSRGSALSKSSFATGETVTVTGAYANTVQLDYTVEILPSQELDSRLTETETLVDEAYNTLGLSVSTQGTLDGPFTWGSYDRSFGYAAKVAGSLSQFSVNVAAAGQGALHVYRKLAGGSFVVASITPLELTAGGVNSFDVDLRVEIGDIIAYAPKAGAQIKYTGDATAEIGVYVTPVPTAVGNTFTNTVATRGSVKFVIRSVKSLDSLSKRVTVLEETPTQPENAVALKYATPLLREMFSGTALPAGWTEAGGWAVDNGLTPPATGGWGCYALSPGYSSLIKRQICAKIRVDDAASVFGICTFPPANSGGAVALVSGSTKTLRLYSWTGTDAAGTYNSEVAIPFNLVVGRSYTLEVFKDGLKSTIRLTDTVTQVSCEVSETQNPAYRQWHGRAGVMFHSGAIKVDWFGVNAGFPKNLRGLIIGDSICEGMYLPLNSPSWAYQVAAARKAEGDFAIAPRAGDQTPNFLLRKVYDLDPWVSQYVVLALGTNDGSQAVWRTNMASLIAQVVAAGGEPILCTQVPRTASQSVRTAMNNDIRSGYFGRHRYIDFAICVSLSNDGVTWDPAYDSGDGIHPNAAGQAKMFAQAMLEAPFLAK